MLGGVVCVMWRMARQHIVSEVGLSAPHHFYCFSGEESLCNEAGLQEREHLICSQHVAHILCTIQVHGN